jgi:amidase
LVAVAATAHAAAPAAAASAPLVYDSITQLQASMRGGTLTSAQFTQAFVDRIHAHDQTRPRVNAVLQLNPDAAKIAAQRDVERSQHAGTPLWGVPVLLKANIDTGDAMPTTAGSLALLGEPALRDATVAARLRQAGAVILGKANLSEWANFRSTHASSGWSGRGGLTRNP